MISFALKKIAFFVGENITKYIYIYIYIVEFIQKQEKGSILRSLFRHLTQN